MVYANQNSFLVIRLLQVLKFRASTFEKLPVLEIPMHISTRESELGNMRSLCRVCGYTAFGTLPKLTVPA